MKIPSDLFFRFRALIRRNTMESELNDELRSHMEHEVDKRMKAGLPQAEATRSARLAFGGVDKITEECRESRGVNLLEVLLQDVRFAVRVMRKSPGFVVVAILTLAIGIGATTAVFSLVNALMFKPLPYPEAERVVIPWRLAPPGVNIGSEQIPWSQIDYRFVTQESNPFQYIGAFQSEPFNLTGAGEPALLEGSRATADFFPALGVSPALGRAFTSEEDKPGNEHEVVLSEQLWRERFGGDPAILGHPIQLNGIGYTVVGVMPMEFSFPRGEEMPNSFNFPREAQLWVPLAVPATPKAGPAELAFVCRLKPGVTLAKAQAQMDIVAKHAEAAHSYWKNWFNSRVTPLSRQVTGDTRRPLLLLLGAVGIVLLIACSNVASLLLTRSLGRRREFSVRAALGAGNRRLVSQLLTESLLLAAVGGVLGVLIGEAAVYFVKRFGPTNIPRLHEVNLDLRVLTFALAITVATGILFGLAPAIGAVRENLAESLRESGQRSGGSAATSKIRSALVVGEIALALVLVIAAGLLGRTLLRMMGADGGFNPSRVLTFELSLPNTRYADYDHIVALYKRVLTQLQSISGVESAGLGETVPISGIGETTVFVLPNRPAKDTRGVPFANYTFVSADFFSAVGTPLLRGRGILDSDTMDSLHVMVINNAMAKKYWPGEDPIGKQITMGSPWGKELTVVGVVADIKHISMREEPAPEMFVPFTQHPWPSMLVAHLALRTRTDPATMAQSVREAIRSVDPELPLAKVATLSALVDDSMAQPRFSMLLVASFGALAILLASIGLYGVISYSVAQRTREIGIRMALGAGRHEVFRMILGQGTKLAGLGIAIGVVAAFGAARMMTSFLYGVEADDPLTFAGVPLFLLAIALLACYIPARRAMRVDPMTALRDE